MAKFCAAPGCHASTGNRLSRFCWAHDKAQRRHGDPLARSIRPHELKPHLKRVERRLKLNPQANLSPFVERWRAIEKIAEDIIAEEEAGRASCRNHKDAARLVLKLRDDPEVEPMGIIKVVCALYVMQYYDPRRFRTDKVLDYALVRKVLYLTDTSVGTWYNHRTGAVHRVQKDPRQKVIEVLAKWIRTALGPLGVRFAQLEDREAVKAKEAKDRASETLSSFQ